MRMAVPMESMRRATEAAISHAAILGPPSVRVGPLVGSAITAPHKTHRHGADGCRTHHGQDHAARAFHVAAPAIHGGRPIVLIWRQPSKQKPKCAVNARANEPKPPRVTPPELESDEVPDEEWLDEVSPPKKLLRDDDPPDQPWPPPEEDPRGGHSALACRSEAIPGRVCPQVSLGISAYAPPPMAKVPISRSATWPERFTGVAVWIATGLRLPNSLLGFCAMISRSSRRR